MIIGIQNDQIINALPKNTRRFVLGHSGAGKAFRCINNEIECINKQTVSKHRMRYQ